MAQIWMQILFKVAQFWMPFNSDDYEIHEIVQFWVVECESDLLMLPEHPECKEDHQGWTELVYVLLDDGFGIEVFVPEHLKGQLK